MKSKFSHILILALFLLLSGILFACKDTTIVEPAQTYMVTFSKNINDVTVSGMPSPQNIEEGKYVTEPTTNPSTALYSFKGWYADEAGSKVFDFTSTKVTNRLTVYAIWELKVTKYNVTFDLNYTGSTEPSTIEVISGETINAPTDPIREGYEFKFWSTQSDANYIYNFDNNVKTNLNLYAIWEALYTLTYVNNIDDSNPSAEEIYSDTQKTVQPTDPMRLNFNFGGWFIDNQFTIPYVHGTTLTSDLTIYAKWIRTSYTVTFDFNFENSTSLIVKATVNADVPVPKTPIREGYIFKNWYTSQTEQTDENLFNFSAVDNDTTIIYAGWIELHTITFDLNYLEAPLATQLIVKAGEEIEAPNPSREGYLFSGWYLDAGCTLSYDFAVVTTNLELFAKWSDATQVTNEYIVTFDLNYEGSEATTQTVVENTVAIRPVDPIREGYRFMSWVIAPTSGTSYKFNAVTEDVIVYARWVNLWKITFNHDYVGADAPVVIEALDGTRISKPENPTRDGLWQFVTWNDENGNPFVFTALIKRDIQIYAVWARSGYTVTWDFNFVDEPTPIVVDVLLGSIAREPQKPNRQGNWAISGWYLDEACTIPFALASEITEDVVLYAKWASGFAYRLDLNYIGSPSIPIQILSDGSMIPTRPTNPTRPDYTFMGWSTAATTNPDFNSFGTPITKDVILYAQWEHLYIFEAEYVNLAGKNGAGWSGGAAGTAMIAKDTITENPELGTNANASNGYFLSYLYSFGLFIDFEITSDRDTEATLTLRLSAEQKDPFVLTDSEYLITINNNKLNYGSITMLGAFAALQQQKLPFEDVVTITINLKEGLNLIRFTTNNLNSLGGTMDSAAPLIDCIKLETIAILSWNPVLENLDLFN